MPPKTLPPWLPYVAPFLLFLLMTTIEGKFVGAYPILYTAKIALTGGLLFYFRGHFPEARPGGKGVLSGLALGVILLFAWVIVDKHTPHFAFLGGRVGYNPFHEIPNAPERAAFLAMRFLGLVVVVPFLEELLYRSFLLRFVTDMDDFQRVPVGVFTPLALLVNVGFFALSHPEWLAAAIFALALCGLAARTKTVFPCVVAHGVTNLLLGIFILGWHQWHYW